jgi:CHASE2 domain-containing sensor protein
MTKVVALSFGNGNLENGFAAVTAQIWDLHDLRPSKIAGSLSPAPELAQLYHQWRLLYLALYQRLDLEMRIKINAGDITNVSEMEFGELCDQFANQLNTWMNSESLRSIDQRLRTQLQAIDEICLIIETNDPLLRRLPWQLWRFFEDYPHAEVALSPAEYDRPQPQAQQTTSSRLRILAVFGDSRGIDTQRDRLYLEQLSTQAEIKYLVEPQLKELNESLWQDWEILFFAGHSSNQSLDREGGLLQINPTDSLTLEPLKYALKRSIARGLKLAIFNSCDGLGLARSLADLQIPQVVVMREPIPDPVAQSFLNGFLTAFAQGKSVYASVRQAREQLQGLETVYPCATWLPVICQNPAEIFTGWSLLPAEPNSELNPTLKPSAGAKTPAKSPVKLAPVKLKVWLPHRGQTLLLSVIVTLLILIVRSLGLLQPWELQAFDRLMQLRPAEPQDQRILVIAVTESDFQRPEQAQRKGSLADLALDRLLQKLMALQPRVIGLDIYRDYPVAANQPTLENRLRTDRRFFAICKGSELPAEPPLDRTLQEIGIAPPPEIPPERQSFSDVVLDPDNVLRRQLVALRPSPTSPCPAPYALSAQLAFQYLAAENLTPRYTSTGQLQIGSKTFKPLRQSRGGYQRIDSWGYQILLNYRAHRSASDFAPIVTLSEALSDQLKPEDVRDRVVLIGVTAASARDAFATPYSTAQPTYQEIPGVLIHAQMVSQLLSAVLNQRPLLEAWSWKQELSWIWLWAAIGGILIGYARYRLWLLGGAGLALFLLCFYLLTQGDWVPLIPAFLALIGTAVGKEIYFSHSKTRNRVDQQEVKP